MCIIKDAFSANDRNKVIHINNSNPSLPVQQLPVTQYATNIAPLQLPVSNSYNTTNNHNHQNFCHSTSIDYDYNPIYNITEIMNKMIGNPVARILGFGPMMDYRQQEYGRRRMGHRLRRDHFLEFDMDYDQDYYWPHRPRRRGYWQPDSYYRPETQFFEADELDHDPELDTNWGPDDDEQPYHDPYAWQGQQTWGQQWGQYPPMQQQAWARPQYRRRGLQRGYPSWLNLGN